MKRTFFPLLLLLTALLVTGCGKEEDPSNPKWDCSVTAAETSAADAYIITYSDAAVQCSQGVLTVQNRNDFPISAHLQTEGQEDRVSSIPPGGSTAFFQMETGQAYTVGLHADVAEGTEILVTVYDGEWSEPFSDNN